MSDLPYVVTMVSKQIFQIKCLEINYLIDDTVNFSFFYRLLYCLCCFSNRLRYLFRSSGGKIEEVTFHRQKKKDLRIDFFTSSSLCTFIFPSLQTFGHLLKSFFQNNLTQLLAYKKLLKCYLSFSSLYSLTMMMITSFCKSNICTFEPCLLNQTLVTVPEILLSNEFSEAICLS